MIDRVPHRATGGSATTIVGRLAAAELATSIVKRLPPQPVRLDDLVIVGDLRLWDELAKFGPAEQRAAILESYRLDGLDAIDRLDGDFAFVIIDLARTELIAVGDRFGVKPLLYRSDEHGIRVGSEPKQLLDRGERPTPCDIAVAEHLANRPDDMRFSYFEGVRRVRPGHAVVVSYGSALEHRYWRPSPAKHDVGPDAIPDAFRTHLVDAVRRHSLGADAIASQLSGGLDSGSIAASAKILAEIDPAMPRFITLSAVYPGMQCDESRWIADLEAHQPFEHRDFVPPIESIDCYLDDMWEIDSPRVDRQRGTWTTTMSLARELGATRLMTGMGGDEVTHEEHLLTDLLRHRLFKRWWDAARHGAEYSWNSRRDLLIDSLRRATPEAIKRPVRMVRKRTPSVHPCTTDEFRAMTAAMPSPPPVSDRSYPSLTQNMVVEYTAFPGMTTVLRLLETHAAYRGLEMTHPYLDRQLVEFVASIPIEDRKFDGRWKAIVREGFADHLPSSVLERTRKTMFVDAVKASFAQHSAEFRNRFPHVTEPAQRYLDEQRYAALMASLDADTPDWLTSEALWTAWSLMLWLEGLERY